MIHHHMASEIIVMKTKMLYIRNHIAALIYYKIMSLFWFLNVTACHTMFMLTPHHCGAFSIFFSFQNKMFFKRKTVQMNHSLGSARGQLIIK